MDGSSRDHDPVKRNKLSNRWFILKCLDCRDSNGSSEREDLSDLRLYHSVLILIDLIVSVDLMEPVFLIVAGNTVLVVGDPLVYFTGKCFIYDLLNTESIVLK